MMIRSTMSICRILLLWLATTATSTYSFTFVATPRIIGSSSAASVILSPSTTTTATRTVISMAVEDDEYARVPVGRRRRQNRRFLDDEDDDDDEEYMEDEYDDEFDDDDDEDEYGLFSNVIIDNPLLDSIDPDGAAERFPELAADPKFWIDMVLFICVLNFLSAIGPRDPFPDLPWY